jgi:hypothetical protein
MSTACLQSCSSDDFHEPLGTDCLSIAQQELTHIRTELAKLKPVLVVSYDEFASAMERLGMSHMPNKQIYDLIDTNNLDKVCDEEEEPRCCCAVAPFVLVLE